MSDFTELRDDIAAVGDSLTSYARTVNAHVDAIRIVTDQLWAEQAELRDEINAVANRVESLTRAVMADPAEVAAAIVNDANRSTLRSVVGTVGRPGDIVTCASCLGSGTTPVGGACETCSGFGQVVHA